MERMKTAYIETGDFNSTVMLCDDFKIVSTSCFTEYIS